MHHLQRVNGEAIGFGSVAVAFGLMERMSSDDENARLSPDEER